jgi:hypothetical protein
VKTNEAKATPFVEPSPEPERIKTQPGEALTFFLICLLVAILYVALGMFIEKRTGRPLHYVDPGAAPPCEPPQIGSWPDCHDPKDTDSTETKK